MQQWDPKQYAEHARFVSDLGMPVVELLSPQPGERILDLGCGDGILTINLAERGCEVVGVDSSPAMVEAARSVGVNAHVVDGHSLPFDNEFDAVFSNAALHWMRHPEGVIGGVWRALKPGGRFVGEFGGFGNVSSIVTAIEAALSSRGIEVPHPWFFPRPEVYRNLLQARGFAVRSIELIPRPTPISADICGWLETFAKPYLLAVLPNQKQEFISEVVTVLRPVLCDAQDHWQVDYVRLRFAATRPRSTGGPESVSCMTQE